MSRSPADTATDTIRRATRAVRGQRGNAGDEVLTHQTNSGDQGAGGISIHAVDVAEGIPAAGLSVRLWHLGAARTEIAWGRCGSDGLLRHPVADGSGVRRGLYEVEFEVGTYFREAGKALPDPSFLETAVFRFGIDRVEEHFHLPFKFTPWGFSLFRGGA